MLYSVVVNCDNLEIIFKFVARARQEPPIFHSRRLKPPEKPSSLSQEKKLAVEATIIYVGEP